MSNAKLKSDLMSKSFLRTIGEDQSKIARALENVPVSKIYQQAQYLEETILPEIERAKTKDHTNYKYWRSVFKSLLWCIAVIDRYDFLHLRYNEIKLENEFYRQRVLHLEAELQKYITVEDLYLSSGLDAVADGIKKRVEDLLTKK